MLSPLLPPAQSWYPGHMSKFTRLLPAFLARTDIVIELRDARLPLTSVNPAFEGAIAKWQGERQKMRTGTTQSNVLCERIVVLGKKDLVGQWGIPPFRKAMQKRFPGLHLHFTSHTQSKTVKELRDILLSPLPQSRNPFHVLILVITGIASQHAVPAPEVNVLMVGMPNVGKSTLLNALRTFGIPGPTPKALRTSAHPGLTRALSTRLKLSLDPLIYAFDSPGVMVPFLGRDDRGAERGVKLALIAGIKEGMYDVEALAAYLAYRLWVLNPSSPAFMTLLAPSAPKPSDIYEFLDSLSLRLGMLQRGGERDMRRAAVWFVNWWREEGCIISATGVPQFYRNPDILAQNPRSGSHGSQAELSSGRAGWGFDFEWDVPISQYLTASPSELNVANIQSHMEEQIEVHIREIEEEKRGGNNISSTQGKKKAREAKMARRRARGRERR